MIVLFQSMSDQFVSAPLDTSCYLLHTVEDMAKGDNLGEFELLILAALMMLGENAYGMTVHEQVENWRLAFGRFPSVRAIQPWIGWNKKASSNHRSPTRPRNVAAGRSGSSRSLEVAKLAMRNSFRVAGNVLAGLRENQEAWRDGLALQSYQCYPQA